MTNQDRCEHVIMRLKDSATQNMWIAVDKYIA